jgi:hypothetical protein
LPAGAHTIEPDEAAGHARVLDFNGDLQSARFLPHGAIELAYHSSARALAVVDTRPLGLRVDGIETKPQMLLSGNHFALSLPAGKHVVAIETFLNAP